jgi:hypothetical protein
VYCTNCGNQSMESEKYCGKCGSMIEKNVIIAPAEVVVQSTETSPRMELPQEQVHTKKYTIWFVIVIIALIGSLSAVIIPELIGKRANGTMFFGLAFWIGVATALYGKRKGKSGLRWFFIGFIGIGFAVVFLIGFLRPFYK